MNLSASPRAQLPSRFNASVQLAQHSPDDDYVMPEVAALIDQRIAEADANPEDFTPLDEFERQVRSRRTP